MFFLRACVDVEVRERGDAVGRGVFGGCGWHRGPGGFWGAYVGILLRLRLKAPKFRGRFGLTGPKSEGQASEIHKEFREHWPGSRNIGAFSLSRS